MDGTARVRVLYSVMQSIENKLGGGEGVEGLYGSVTKGGMQKVIASLRDKCGLDASSRLVDIGAGLGRPLLHALVEPGIASAFGVEIDRIKCDKAAAFLRQAVAELARRSVTQQQLEAPAIQCSPIEQVKSLDPCTHAYSFWEGVPFDGKMAFGRLFAGSRTLRSVAVVQRAMRGKQDPAEVMEELGFGELVLVDSFSVSMSGSGRSFTAYIFNKVDLPAPLPPLAAAELAAAERLPTPALSQDSPRLALSAAPSVDQQEGEEGEEQQLGDATAGAAPGATEEPQQQEQQQQQPPGLGRGARRAARSRKAAEAAAVEAVAAEAAAQQQPQRRRATRAGAKAADQGKEVQHQEQHQEQQAAEAAEVVLPAAAAGRRANGSPGKLKGVQKRQSPRKQHPSVLLPDAHVRRPRNAAGLMGKGGKAASNEDAATSPRPVRRGLLA